MHTTSWLADEERLDVEYPLHRRHRDHRENQAADYADHKEWSARRQPPAFGRPDN
jgi:hypothetical protein